MPYTEEYYEKKPNYEELAKKLMRLFGKDEQNSEFKGFVAALEPDQLAGVYHYLHDEGGLGKLEGNTLAQIASGTLQNRNPKYIQAAIALRVMMDEIPGSHRARHSMIDYPPGHGPNPQEPGEPWSPEMQQYLASRKKQFGDYKQRKGLQEGTNMKLTKTYIMKVIKEEIQNVLDEDEARQSMIDPAQRRAQSRKHGAHKAYSKGGAISGVESEKSKTSVPVQQTPAAGEVHTGTEKPSHFPQGRPEFVAQHGTHAAWVPSDDPTGPAAGIESGKLQQSVPLSDEEQQSVAGSGTKKPQ